MRTRVRRPQPSMLVASVALFVSLGGVSWAAATLPRDSVGTKQLRAGAVRATDLRDGAVTSAAVRDGGLRAVDFATGQLPSGAPGPRGAVGPAGPKGDPGAPARS